MSGFQFDIPWVASNLPPHIPVCLALHNSIPTPPKIQGNIHLVFPKVGATYSTMHVKLYVLYYDSCVRVVISSANLVDYDWNALENIVFCQDFALKEYVGTSSKEEIALPDRAASSPLGDVFKQDLIALLKEMEVAEWVWQGLDPFDFSPCRAQLIVSRPGKHTGKDVDKYGLGRLSMVVKDACPDLATAETTDLRMIHQAWDPLPQNGSKMLKRPAVVASLTPPAPRIHPSKSSSPPSRRSKSPTLVATAPAPSRGVGTCGVRARTKLSCATV
ncbi:hypothetical protein BC830DRAFT_488576 [Chytriomyces sp. MP71]|nr:hypothetical protein BC830DRAFT_488576 [Chytriomyces sp. MP71]